MQTQNTIISVFLTLLLVNACSTPHQAITVPVTTSVIAPAPTEFSVVETPVISFVTPVNSITTQEALEQMYGKDIRIQPNHELHDALFTSIKNVTYYIRVKMLSCYRDYLGAEPDREKCLFITERSTGYGCIMCGNYIDGAVFDRAPSGWKIHALKSNMITLGTFGQTPKGELIQIGRGKFAALLRGSYSKQGAERESLVIIAETVQSFGIVFKLPTSRYKYNNNIDSNWGFTSKLEFYPNEENIEYDNIIVNYYGTPQDDKTPPMQVYKFMETQYVLDYEGK